MKSEKLQEWQDNLKKGTPIRVLYNHFELIGIFVSWKAYSWGNDDNNRGCDYMCIPYWGNDDSSKIANCQKCGPYLDRILNGGDRRIRPLDEQWLSETDKKCLEILKNKIYEY